MDPPMRRNALTTITLPTFTVLLLLISLSAVSHAEERSVLPNSNELLHDVDVRQTRTLTMEVTAYCPCRKCCGKNARGLTASGARVSHNAGLFVAADTALLPFH